MATRYKKLRIWIYKKLFYRPRMMRFTWFRAINAPPNVMDEIFPNRANAYHLNNMPRNRHGRKQLSRWLGTNSWKYTGPNEVQIDWKETK